MKIVINKCFGGFSVSEAVYVEMGLAWDGLGYHPTDSEGEDMERNNPRLIAAIEKVGLEESSGSSAELKIVEIPDDVDWYIHEYDGMEDVYEEHRSWG